MCSAYSFPVFDEFYYFSVFLRQIYIFYKRTGQTKAHFTKCNKAKDPWGADLVRSKTKKTFCEKKNNTFICYLFIYLSIFK